MSRYTLWIDGVGHPVLLGSLQISAVANGIHTLTAAIASVDASYRPALDAAVVVTDDLSGSPARRLFGGFITTPAERGLAALGDVPIVTTIQASDFNSLASRVFLNETLPAGSLKAALLRIAAQFATDGYPVTLDPAQVTGPDLPALTLTYSDASRVDAVLNQLSSLTATVTQSAYLWEIDYDGVLRMFAPGVKVAPFDIAIGAGDPVGDLEIVQTRDDTYANRIIGVINRPPQTALLNELVAVTDGVATSWPTYFSSVDAATYWPGSVYIEDAAHNQFGGPIGPYAPGDTANLFAIQWDATTHTIYQRAGDAPLAAGLSIRLTYLANAELRKNQVESFVGDGVTTAFTLAGRYAGDVGYVTLDGINETLGVPLGDVGSWTINQLTNQVVRNGVPALGADIRVTYHAAYALSSVIVASDPAAIAAHGLWAAVVSLDTLADGADAQAAAEAILAQRNILLQEAKYPIDRDGLEPGQIQHIAVALREVDADFLIRSVTTRDRADAPGLLTYDVEAVASASPFVIQGDFRDVYKAWLGRGRVALQAASGSTSGGGTLPPPPPGDRRQVLFNDAGQFGAAADLLYDKNATGDAYGADAAPASLAVLIETEGVTPTADVLLLVGAEVGILDDSTYARALTAVGTAARTTAQFKYGAGSLTFDGTGDWIQAADAAELTLGAGDFTIEGWFRFLTKTDNQTLLGHWDNAGLVANSSWLFSITGGSLRFAMAFGTTIADVVYVTTAWAPTLSQWYHVAVDRHGSDVRLYIDGAAVTLASVSVTLNDCGHPLTLGAIGTTGHFVGTDFQGQMDEVRITKGRAWYAGAFTPPTSAFPRARRLLAAFANRAAGLAQAVTLQQTDAGATTLTAPALTIAAPGAVDVRAATLTVNGAGVVTGLTGDVTASGAGTGTDVPATIAAGAVTDAKFRSSVGPSVVGRPGNSTGPVTDIGAAADGTVLKRSSSALAFGAVTEAELVLADLTAWNVATTRHGFAPKLPNDARKFLDGTGAYSTPAGGSTHYDCPLSDGDLLAADLIFAAGECIVVQVPV